MIKFFKLIGRDSEGATAVEYGLILALIFLGMIAGVSAFGSESTGMWGYISDTIINAPAGSGS